MNLIVLGAGRGSRLRPLTNTTPKCMVKVNGKPLLQYIKEASQLLKPSRTGIVVGYLAERVETFDWHVTYNANWDRANMVESLLLMDKWLSSDVSIVTYSDIFYGHRALLSLERKSQAPISIVYSDSWKKYWNLRFEDPLSDAENFKISKDRKVLNISGRPESLDQVDGQYMGLIKFTPSGWKILE
jgi:choline kinase